MLTITPSMQTVFKKDMKSIGSYAHHQYGVVERAYRIITRQ